MQVSKRTVTATIANGTTTSTEIDLTKTDIVGIYIPAAFTGTAITFTSAFTSGGTFGSVRDGAGAALSLTVAQGQFVKVSPADFIGILYLKIVSGSTEGAARELRVAVRPLSQRKWVIFMKKPIKKPVKKGC